MWLFGVLGCLCGLPLMGGFEWFGMRGLFRLITFVLGLFGLWLLDVGYLSDFLGLD